MFQRFRGVERGIVCSLETPIHGVTKRFQVGQIHLHATPAIRFAVRSHFLRSSVSGLSER
jgi:hypothetical protein